jgi:DNA replication protein DnaC
VRACPFGICDGSGMVVDEDRRVATPCRCRGMIVGERRARGLSNAIPRKYQGVAFDRPPVTEIDPSRVQIVRRYVRNLDENLEHGRGLWFYGDPGTGKTSLAMLVSKTALEAGRSVAIYSLPRLLAEIRSTYEEGSRHTYVGLLDRLAEVDLLHIDDVGAENSTGWVLEQLYSIVNARYEEQRSIVLTTNLQTDELEEQLRKRVVSRLEEMCEVIPLFGDDARLHLRTA